jgi:hypothetical protein
VNFQGTLSMEKRKSKVPLKKKKKIKKTKESNSLDELKESLIEQKKALHKIIKNIQHEEKKES